MGKKKFTYIFGLFLFIMSFSILEEKRYERNYYDNGMLKSEGWMRYTTKTDYWRFYYPNGKLSEQGFFEYDKKEKYWFFYDENRIRTEEGHYQNNERDGWWLYYDNKGRVNHKCELNKSQKDGYCLKYEEGKLVSAEHYSEGEKRKEWTDLDVFTHENSLSDLK